MDFYNKYIKYKTKYLNLKQLDGNLKQLGGNLKQLGGAYTVENYRNNSFLNGYSKKINSGQHNCGIYISSDEKYIIKCERSINESLHGPLQQINDTYPAYKIFPEIYQFYKFEDNFYCKMDKLDGDVTQLLCERLPQLILDTLPDTFNLTQSDKEMYYKLFQHCIPKTNPHLTDFNIGYQINQENPAIEKFKTYFNIHTTFNFEIYTIFFNAFIIKLNTIINEIRKQIYRLKLLLLHIGLDYIDNKFDNYAFTLSDSNHEHLGITWANNRIGDEYFFISILDWGSGLITVDDIQIFGFNLFDYYIYGTFTLRHICNGPYNTIDTPYLKNYENTDLTTDAISFLTTNTYSRVELIELDFDNLEEVNQYTITGNICIYELNFNLVYLIKSCIIIKTINSIEYTFSFIDRHRYTDRLILNVTPSGYIFYVNKVTINIKTMKLYIIYLNGEIIEYQLTYFNYKTKIDEVIDKINLDLIESIINYKIIRKINESEFKFTFRDSNTYLILHTPLIYYNYTTTINKSSNQLLVKFNEQDIYEATLTLANYKEKINEMFNKTDLINLIENYSTTILECTFKFKRDGRNLTLITEQSDFVFNNGYIIYINDIQNIDLLIGSIKIFDININNYKNMINNIILICYITSLVFNIGSYKFHFVYEDDFNILKLDNFETSKYKFDNKTITINILDMVLSFKEFGDTINQQFSIKLTLNNFQQTIQNYISYLF